MNKLIKDLTKALRAKKLGYAMSLMLVFPNTVQVNHRASGEWKADKFTLKKGEKNADFIKRIVDAYLPMSKVKSKKSVSKKPKDKKESTAPKKKKRKKK